MNIEIKLTQLQESNTEFSLTEIERENLSLFKVKDLPLEKKNNQLIGKRKRLHPRGFCLHFCQNYQSWNDRLQRNSKYQRKVYR